MGLPFVNLQAILRLGLEVTVITLKALYLHPWLLVGLQTRCRSKFRGGLLFEKILPALGISSEGGWTLLLPCRKGLLTLPGVQGEGEGGARGALRGDLDGEPGGRDEQHRR